MTSTADGYDAIIVGGGTNGLTCAAFLARAGKRVLVLEAGPLVGGFATTEELTPEAPGFRYNKHAVDLFSGMIPTSVASDLDLARYGFRTVVTDPYATFLGPEGSSICQWRDIDRTAGEIAHFSRRDAERYRRFAQILGEAWNAFLPYLQGHPKKVTPRTFAETIGRAAKARKSLGPAARILVSSPAQVLDEWFERDELKVILGTWAAATGQVSLETPGSAAGMAMAVLSHRWGCYRAVGGMGAFSDALAACVRAHGGEIRTDAPVERIEVSGGRAAGVVLAGSGEELRGGDVIAAVDPATLFGKLVDPAELPEETRDELRAMTICESNITYYTGHAALSERPSFPAYGDAERTTDILRSGYQMLVPTYASLRQAVTAAERGEVPAQIPTWASFPSVCDRSLVPPDSSGETLYFMTPVTPYDLSDGRSWEEQKQPYLDRVLAGIDGYAPGLGASVIDACGVTPVEMAGTATKGHACHIDMSLSQLGPWRPTPSLAGYATPIERLWHTSAGAHPLPSVNGWAGRTAARTVLRARRGESVPPVARVERTREPV